MDNSFDTAPVIILLLVLAGGAVVLYSNTQKQSIRLLLGGLIGWIIAVIAVFVISGDSKTGEYWLRFVAFLSLAPGGISGLLVTHMLNKKSSNSVDKKTMNSDNVKSVPEQLQVLKSLLDSGVLSQEEFEDQKKKILGIAEPSKAQIITPTYVDKKEDTITQGISGQLIELKSLLDSQAISKDEYDQLKQQLLSKM